MRVGTLCLNLFNALLENQLTFFSLSKPELYQFAYHQGKLPRFATIYIGQKHNIRLRDLQKHTAIQSEGTTTMVLSFDQLQELRNHQTELSESLILDVTAEKTYYPSFLREYPQITYPQILQWIKGYAETHSLIPTNTVEANYLIDPMITPARRGK